MTEVESNEIVPLAWCMSYALHASKEREIPSNEIYWYTREKVFQYIRSFPGPSTINWSAILKEFDIARHEFDIRILKENCGSFWVRFAHPEIIMREVHDS